MQDIATGRCRTRLLQARCHFVAVQVAALNLTLCCAPAAPLLREPECFWQALYFDGRYELDAYPAHQSSTCLVICATDHGAGMGTAAASGACSDPGLDGEAPGHSSGASSNGSRVAIKFFFHSANFLRELNARLVDQEPGTTYAYRSQAQLQHKNAQKFSEMFVVPLLAARQVPAGHAPGRGGFAERAVSPEAEVPVTAEDKDGLLPASKLGAWLNRVRSERTVA